MERQEAVECFTREAEPVLEEGKKLTEIVNELLRDGLSKYLIG